VKWSTVTRKICAKTMVKMDHQEQRVQHRPENAQRRALVADLEVARDEVPQEAPVADDLAQRFEYRLRVAKGAGEGKPSPKRRAAEGNSPPAD